MGQADGDQAQDEMKSWDEAGLEAVRFDWGEAYEIEAWRGKRRDGLGGWIEATDPDGLGRAIKEDHAVRPVPRGGGVQR
jgi:hypothetical protein